jgi:hypothetical protein
MQYISIYMNGWFLFNNELKNAKKSYDSLEKRNSKFEAYPWIELKGITALQMWVPLLSAATHVSCCKASLNWNK